MSNKEQLWAEFAARHAEAVWQAEERRERVYRENPALCYGDFHQVHLTNRQVIFERSYQGERILVAINADSSPYMAHFNANAGRAVDLLTGKNHDFGGGSELPPYSAAFWKIYD